MPLCTLIELIDVSIENRIDEISCMGELYGVNAGKSVHPACEPAHAFAHTSLAFKVTRSRITLLNLLIVLEHTGQGLHRSPEGCH